VKVIEGQTAASGFKCLADLVADMLHQVMQLCIAVSPQVPGNTLKFLDKFSHPMPTQLA